MRKITKLEKNSSKLEQPNKSCSYTHMTSLMMTTTTTKTTMTMMMTMMLPRGMPRRRCTSPKLRKMSSIACESFWCVLGVSGWTDDDVDDDDDEEDESVMHSTDAQLFIQINQSINQDFLTCLKQQ